MERSITEDVAAVARLPAVDKILQAVSWTTGLRFAAVARVTEHSWTACAVRDEIDFGLAPGGELALETTLCNEIRQHQQPVVFGHASADLRYAGHPTPKLYGFESYISIPIVRRDGSFFGTLCALDPEPAKLDDPNIVHTLQLFADLISEQMESSDALSRSDHALRGERDVALLRDQFIAVLGHDLRNPLQVLSTYTHLLSELPLDPRWTLRVQDMQKSCERMSSLIRDVLDFARGRLGNGIPVTLCDEADLASVLEDVVAEVRAAHPGHAVHARIDLAGTVRCDRNRLSQLLANLLVNAVTHGEAQQPVLVEASESPGRFELAVSNAGLAIPEHRVAELFEPFARREPGQRAEGLGLGLYIANQIARAHGGTLAFERGADDSTRFVFRMPITVAGVEARESTTASIVA